MSDMREAFELIFPVPRGVKWSEGQNDYLHEHTDALQVACNYSGKWMVWRLASAQKVDPDLQLIEQRDHWEEKATELAETVGSHFGFDVGEHSSANCPVRAAIDQIGEHNADRAQGDAEPAQEELPIVWINPENLPRTMIAAPGETVEVSAYREGELTAPLYTRPPSAGVPEITDEIVTAATKAVRENRGKANIAVASHVLNSVWPLLSGLQQSMQSDVKQGVPEGYAIVPIKPTKEMKAACKVAGKTKVWDDMMSARPQPPKQEGGSTGCCCCGETEGAWRLCPEHGPKQEGA